MKPLLILFGIVILAIPAYADLVAYLPFDNNTAIGDNATFFVDVSYNNHNGYCVPPACPVYSDNGIVNGSIRLTETVSVVNFTNYDLSISNEVTVALWIRPNETSSTQWIIPFSKGDIWGDITLALNVDDGWSLFVVKDNTDTTHFLGHYGNPVYNFTEWVFMAGTYDSGNIQTMYILNTTSNTLFIKNSSRPAPIKNNNTGVPIAIAYTQEIGGYIDEFRIYNHSLSKQELELLAGVCVENWIPSNISGPCLINDTYNITKIYTDANDCNKTEDLPNDNGTVSYGICNYCSQDIQQTLSLCLYNGTAYTRTRGYKDLNYATCCAVTNLTSDCGINFAPYNVSTTEPCTQPTENNMYLTIGILILGIILVLIKIADRLDFMFMKDGQGNDIPIMKYLVWLIGGWLLLVVANITVRLAELADVNLYPSVLGFYRAVIVIMIVVTAFWLIGFIFSVLQHLGFLAGGPSEKE